MTDFLSDEQGKQLLRLARETIDTQLSGRQPVQQQGDSGLDSERGTFVTLKIGGQLRGCIGNLLPSGSVLESVQRNALNAAFNDHRFSPLTGDELARVHIDISILTEPVALEYDDGDDLIHKLRPGVDGVILSHGRHSATFLPQVWDQLPAAELFLGHLCRKAGLNDHAWRDHHPQIKIYQVQCFEEETT
ncbi:MAG: AmmeMemoRadiSam system protein A [Thermodesulfobacteriota bacterium]